jgi:hypothetical protein
MTPRQVTVLSLCARTDPALPGMPATFGATAGYERQINWLLNRKLIRRRRGRYIITRDGRKILTHQLSH